MRHRTLPTLLTLAAALGAQDPTPPADRPIPRIHDLGGPFPAATDEDAEPAAVDIPGVMARLVRAAARPPLAADEDVRSIGDRWLVLLARPERHAWLESLLESLRDPAITGVVETECWVLSAPESVYLRDIAPRLMTQQRLIGETTSFVLAPGAETDEFIAALTRHDRVDSIQTPRVTQRPFLPATLSTLSYTSYVKSFDVKPGPGAAIADPVVGKVKDGVEIATAAAPLDDGSVALSIDVVCSTLERPIPTFTSTLGGTKVTIQVPNVRIQRTTAAVQLRPGHRLLLTPPPQDGLRLLVIVTTAALPEPRPPEEPEPPADPTGGRRRFE